MADNGRHACRIDEPSGTCGAVRRRDAEALVDQQHDAHASPPSRSCSSSGCCTRTRWGSATRSTGSRTRATGFFGNFIGKPGPSLSHKALQEQANIPLIGSDAFPQSSLVYFQFVFAAITPILMLGSVLGRINFKAWIPFVVLWITFVYTINAFLIWGGGFFGHHGALDFSGGYVIHLSAGVSGFVAAWVIGPRLQRDREVDAPNNLAMVAVGAGIAVDRLERVQRRRPVRGEHVGGGGGPQHEPLHRGRVHGVGRLGLHHRPQAEHDRRRQRASSSASWRSPQPPVTSTARGRSRSA